MTKDQMDELERDLGMTIDALGDLREELHEWLLDRLGNHHGTAIGLLLHAAGEIAVGCHIENPTTFLQKQIAFAVLHIETGDILH